MKKDRKNLLASVYSMNQGRYMKSCLAARLSEALFKLLQAPPYSQLWWLNSRLYRLILMWKKWRLSGLKVTDVVLAVQKTISKTDIGQH